MWKFIVSAFLVVFLLNFSDAIKSRCNEQEDLIQRCSMALPVLSSREISVALDEMELNKTCIGLRVGINCIDNFTHVCLEKHEQSMFRNVYSGIRDVVTELCNPNSNFQKEYLGHAHCVKTVRADYEQCSKKYEATLTSLTNKAEQFEADHAVSSTREDHLRTVCCSFQEYLMCSETTVQARCGDDTARFTKEFLKRMSSNIITNYCLEYRSHECGLPDKATGLDHSVIMIGVALLANLATHMLNTILVPT